MSNQQFTDLVTTVSELATRMSVTVRTVYDWKTHPTWIFTVPPYDVQAVRIWRAENLKPQPKARSKAERTRSLDATVQLKRSRIAKLQVETRLLQDEFTKTSDVDEIIRELITMMLIPLEQMVAELPPMMVGQTAPAIERIIVDRVELMRSRWSRKIQDAIDKKDHSDEN